MGIILGIDVGGSTTKIVGIREVRQGDAVRQGTVPVRQGTVLCLAPAGEQDREPSPVLPRRPVLLRVFR